MKESSIWHELSLNTIHHWDCLELMRLIPDKSIDLVLTDPPYGIGMNKHFGNWANEKMVLSDEDWDTQIPPKEYFDEIFRISKNQIIWGATTLHNTYHRKCVGWYGIRIIERVPFQMVRWLGHHLIQHWG